MASNQIPWPMQAMPGRRPGEGQGDLCNGYALKIGDIIQIRRTPGLVRYHTLADTVARVPRGMHATPSRLFHVWDDEILCLNTSGVAIPITGMTTLPGMQRVTMAHNNRDEGAELAIVTDGDAYLLNLTTNALAAYPDPMDMLNNVGSVEYFAGYFIFTRADGYLVASDLENSEIIDLSMAKASASADTLLRTKSMQAMLLAFGSMSTEVWIDVATAPFPLQRQTVIDVGLLGRWCVAGGTNEWERGVFFVANDYTVRQMQGLVPRIVSTDDVAQDIYGCRSMPDDIVAQVYSFEQQAVFSITCPSMGWTWEYNTSTEQWHRRESYDQLYWRGTSATHFNNRWYVQDFNEAKIFEVKQGVYHEDGDRMRFLCESAPMKTFPASVRIPSIEIDCSVAIGKLNVPSPYETDPAIMVSWSHDGGATWSNPLQRSLGRLGRYGTLVTVRNLGRSTHHGTRIRVEATDPVPVVIQGGIARNVSPSRPRQVYR